MAPRCQRRVRMSDRPHATLEFLAREQEQILAELASIRAYHAALLAIVQRIDAVTHGRHGPPPVDRLAPDDGSDP